MKRFISTSVLCLTIGLTAAACGGSSGDATDSTSQAAGQAQGSQAQAQGGRGPGGSGEVTEVSGSTAQVKGQESQVAVSWTDSTTFTQQVSAAAADVTVGSCVMVTSADSSDSSTDTVAAATVRITEAVDGECSAMGGGGPQGGGPGGGEAPSGERPTDRPSDAPDGGDGQGRPGGGQRGGFAVGEVTAVTDAGFTVSSQQPGAAADEATTVTVTTSADTTYTTTAEASADDVTVGACVTSRGEADDTGAITATTISVSQPVDGACASGFGGGRPAAAS